jgi:hypothetical protein
MKMEELILIIAYSKWAGVYAVFFYLTLFEKLELETS